MLDKTFLQKKMDLLSGYIAKLGQLVANSTVTEIRKDEVGLAAIERYFQLAVDQMVDINTHLIKTGDLGTVDDLQSTFKMLGDCGVLKKDFSRKIAPIVGVRNMLVHRYEKLDADTFLQNLKNNFSDFSEYVIQIDAYLKKSA